MSDGLTAEERVLAWCASWDPAFVGCAIVDSSFTFRSVNPQFCEMLGVTPAELIGKTFQEITLIRDREIDARNAQLVMDGVIDSYIMEKRYEFLDGRVVPIILLVKGVYAESGEFLFFLSRIMLNSAGNGPLLECPAPPHESHAILDYIKKYGAIFAAIGTFIGTAVWALLKHYLKEMG